jgi:hypothetical protein
MDLRILISKFSYVIIFIFLVLTALLFGQSANPCVITGSVIDSTTAEPIQLVNVYLSGTTFGASTSQSGIYCIENIPAGSYQLIFQHVGYEIKIKNILVEDDQRYEIAVQLQPKIYDFNEIQVSTAKDTKWKNQFDLFRKEFIGESENAENCEILNPEVLNFRLGQDSRQFIAFTDSILRIRNNSLGYHIDIILVDFRYDGDFMTSYRIHPKFKILTARNESEQEQWIQNRKQTFQGSLKHFLSVLARGKIMEENFSLFSANNVVWLRGLSSRIISGDSLKIKDMKSPLYKKFFFDDYLIVSYWQGNLSPPSILKFKQDYIVIDTLGNVLTPGVVEMGGEWYKQRIADTLPREYIPTN